MFVFIFPKTLSSKGIVIFFLGAWVWNFQY